jgi:hypothetical protein
VGHDGRIFFAVFQKIPEGANPVGELYGVVVVKEENPEPPEPGNRDKIFGAVDPVAEGGPEIHEPRNSNVLAERSGRHRVRKEQQDQEQKMARFNPFEVCRLLLNGHEIRLAVLLN